MKRRRLSRTMRQVPVTVSGTDSSGQPFVQSANTVNVSSQGVHLEGVHCLRAVGDPVKVQYRKRQAIYRVAWIGGPGSPLEGHAGLENVDGGKFLFADMIPAPAVEEAGGDLLAKVAPEPEPVAPAYRGVDRRKCERRRHKRFGCAASAHLRCDDGPAVEARVNELSQGGCYVEMMSPFPVGAKLQMEIELLGRKLRCEGQVRTSQQHFGMGVMFGAMTPADAAQLRHIVAELSGEPLPPESPPAPAAEEATRRPSVGDAVLAWFATHDSLSRAELMELVRESAAEPALQTARSA